MKAHRFIFSPGEWLGYGTLTFSRSPAVLQFYTKWKCNREQDGVITCEQFIEKQEVEEIVLNQYRFSEITATSFDVQLYSEAVGTVKAKGVIDGKTIAWRFQQRVPFADSAGFEGVESYSLQENGDYTVHAEYIADFEHRTVINGKLWERS